MAYTSSRYREQDKQWQSNGAYKPKPDPPRDFPFSNPWKPTYNPSTPSYKPSAPSAPSAPSYKPSAPSAPVSNPYLDLLEAQKAEQERLRQEQLAIIAKREQEKLEALSKRKQEQLDAIKAHKEEQLAYINGQKEQQLGTTKSKYDELLAYLDKSYGEGNERLTNEKTSNLQGGFVQNEIAKRDMAQMNAAVGNTGGLSESSIIGQNTAYQAARNSSEEHYGNLLKDLLMQTDEAKTNAKTGYTDQANSIEQKISDALMNLNNQASQNISNVENQTFDNMYDVKNSTFDLTYDANNAYSNTLNQIQSEYAKQAAAQQAAQAAAAKRASTPAKVNTSQKQGADTSNAIYGRAKKMIVSGSSKDEVVDYLLTQSGQSDEEIAEILASLGYRG